MITDSDIAHFQQQLLLWYSLNGRIFRWREKRLSQYQIIIAEVLLQRTKAETVSKFYDSFLETYPNWKSLMIAGPDQIGEHLRPVGLYQQRAKRLHALAVEMVKRSGRLPRDRKELESIPFLGQYIANSIELVIFRQPSPLLDVNMARVLERYFGERKMADIRYDPYLQELAKRVVDVELSKELNWAVLDFAALVCKARRPLCENCLLKTNCLYILRAKK
jgi:A/G-specific adenine glycosylase